MKIIAVIPARMASSRFPGKPLKKIKGQPMLKWVYNGIINSELLTDVVVATCDEEIQGFCELNNIKCVMTSDKHERASDRAQEAVEYLEKSSGSKFDIVVMVQGDEPMVNKNMINKALEPLLMGEYRISNLMQTMDEDSWEDPGEVKVVVNSKDEAIYFSREPIPSKKKFDDDFPKYKQVCIIPFERGLLDIFSSLDPTPLEIIESVDMLRLIENNIAIKMVLTDDITYSVDTIQDLNKVEKLI